MSRPPPSSDGARPATDHGTVDPTTGAVGSRSAPERTCVGCRLRRPQDALLRFAATPDGVRLDQTGNLPGRGAYTTPHPVCLERIGRRAGQPLVRALRLTAQGRSVPQEHGSPTQQVQHALADAVALVEELDHHEPPPCLGTTRSSQ